MHLDNYSRKHCISQPARARTLHSIKLIAQPVEKGKLLASMKAR